MIANNLKLLKIKFKIFLQKNFEFSLLCLLTSLSIVINLISKPNYGFDAFIWIPLTDNFFENIGDSIGIHRPLFAFISYIVNLFFHFFIDNSESFTWRFLNYIYFILSIIFFYKGSKILFNSKEIAALSALSLAISPQFLANLHVININLHGFFILFFSYYLLIFYFFNNHIFIKKHNLVFISAIFGLMMLGKAHYNIFLAIIFFGIFTFKKKYLIDTLIFTLTVIFILLFYMSILDLFNLSYQNYEIKRSDYSLLDRITNDILIYDSYFYSLYYWLERSIQESNHIMFIGLGPIYLLSFFYYLGSNLLNRIGFYFLIYYVGTALFLNLTSFSIFRHAGDFSIISYLGLSFMILGLKNIFFYENEKLYRLLISIFFLFFLIINSSNLLHEPIHGQCYYIKDSVEQYNNFIAVFFDNFMLNC